MDREKRKALLDSYRNRTITGGIYCIRCSGNNRVWLRSTRDLEGVRNRAMFSLKMKGAPEPAMLRECNEYGPESFSFEVLEEMNKGAAKRIRNTRTISPFFSKYGRRSMSAVSFADWKAANRLV